MNSLQSFYNPTDQQGYYNPTDQQARGTQYSTQYATHYDTQHGNQQPGDQGHGEFYSEEYGYTTNDRRTNAFRHKADDYSVKLQKVKLATVTDEVKSRIALGAWGVGNRITEDSWDSRSLVWKCTLKKCEAKKQGYPTNGMMSFCKALHDAVRQTDKEGNSPYLDYFVSTAFGTGVPRNDANWGNRSRFELTVTAPRPPNKEKSEKADARSSEMQPAPGSAYVEGGGSGTGASGSRSAQASSSGKGKHSNKSGGRQSH